LGFEKTATRLWKHLSPDERRAAATHFWEQPDAESAATAFAAIAKARRLRPQVARSLPVEERARALATILEPGEMLAASLLVALHLSERRPLLAAFLDAIGLRHEDGVLADEEAELPPLGEEPAAKAWDALLERFPEGQVRTYLNTLWLQDPDRWAVLGSLAEARLG
jgi:hypothetical protein